MAIESDVLVVGGGLAGSAAALSAATEGADVRLVTHKESTLRQASGLIDVLGYAPDGDGPVVDPFDRLPDLPPAHPYALVGVDGVREGLTLFDDVVGDRYRGGHTDRNALIPTHGGTVKPTARYPASTAAGLASDERDVLLVGFERLTDFDAPLAADHLAATGAPFDVRGVTVSFPADLRDDAKVTRFAHALDRDEAVGDGGDGNGAAVGDARDGNGAAVGDARGVRAALGDPVGAHHEGEPRVGFPAVLGDEHPAAVRSTLADHLDADVFEVPMGPPSLPGLRLADDLDHALRDAGASVTAGNPVVDARTDDGRIDEVLVDRNGQRVPFRAQQYVLATGGLVGKGIDSDRGGVREPVFGCHVPHPDDRVEWYDVEAFGDHRFARFGVVVDDDLRPLDAVDDPEYDNLRAAGSVLGGYDFAAENSGAGVSLATGTVAGRRAAERATAR